MEDNKFYVYRCIGCSCHYEIVIPRTQLVDDTVLHGFCSNDCITHYARRYDIHPRVICRKDIKQLKELGHHELADWVVAGGLEQLMEKEDDN